MKGPTTEKPSSGRRARLGLTARLTLLLGLAVLMTLGLAWFLTGRAVIAPFTRDVLRAHLEQVAFVADELEGGADLRTLGRRLGIKLRRVERLPRPFRTRGPRGRTRCRDYRAQGRVLRACRGRRGVVATRLRRGWLVAQRPLDPEAPERRVIVVLVVVGAVVLAISAGIASVVARPVRASVEAMERMAGGDLSHRLAESGFAEASGVSRAFNRMADRVAALLAAERSLMAGISHELRTPLARLRLELELLRDRDVPERRVAAMEADVEDIDRLIGEILESSRLALGEREVRFSDVDLREVVEEALGMQPLPDHVVRLEGEARLVRGDHARLVRVVRNLLENAGKYAEKETEIRIQVEGTAVEVCDRGPGVLGSDIPRLFEPFYRGRGRSPSATGYGLGLMIVKQVVALHDGHLEARNRPGGGLCVRFTLPDYR